MLVNEQMRSASGRGKPLSAPTRERIMPIAATLGHWGTRICILIRHSPCASCNDSCFFFCYCQCGLAIGFQSQCTGAPSWVAPNPDPGTSRIQIHLHLLRSHRAQMSRQRVRKVACDGDGNYKRALRGRRRMCYRTRVHATRATTPKHSLGVGPLLLLQKLG
jgi:hypothetical protein